MSLGPRQTFYVSSELHNPHFVGGTASNFRYQFDLTPNNNYDSVVVLQASIPKSYYQITTSNGSFTLTEEKKSATITLDPGFYDKRSFATILQTALNTGSPNGWAYTVSYPNRLISADTQKYTYSVSGNGGLQPGFTFGTTSEFIHNLMGFSENETYSFVGDSLTAPFIMNFQPTSALLIKSDLVKNHDGILQEIFASGEPFMTHIKYQASDTHYNAKELSTNKSNIYSFVICDTDGNEISTNGASIHLSLCFFKRDDHNEIAKKSILLNALEALSQV